MRRIRASWPSVLVALAAVLAALVGNILINPKFVQVFALYFLAAVTVVTLMFQRVQILKLALALSEAVLERLRRVNTHISQWIIGKIQAKTVTGIGTYYTKQSWLFHGNFSSTSVQAIATTRLL